MESGLDQIPEFHSARKWQTRQMKKSRKEMKCYQNRNPARMDEEQMVPCDISGHQKGRLKNKKTGHC